MRLQVEPASQPLRGSCTPPGDKSISHRALIFAGLARGESEIAGLLVSGDTTATRKAMEQLGARFTEQDGVLRVQGTGASGLRPPEQVLDMGNSGTAMRLLAGVLAGQEFSSVLSGDASLNKRPMGRIIRPLEQMGARITAEAGGNAPLHIQGGALQGISYDSPVASAQVKSCLLLAGLFAQGTTHVREPRLSRDHTERMLPQFGVKLDGDGAGPGVTGGQQLQAAPVAVPADPSSAAFLAAAALIVPGSDIRLEAVGMNPTRDGFYRALELMGAELERHNPREQGGEPVVDLRLRYSPQLKGIDLPPEWVPSMIDEIPILLALAARAKGLTRIRDAAELRVKESDRIAVMAAGLAAMGITVKEYPDGIDLTGGDSRCTPIASQHDHRCAMSFAVLGLVSEGGALIDDAEYIDTSYPGFRNDLQALGATLTMAGS